MTEMQTRQEAAEGVGRRPTGPHPGVLALVVLGLTVAAVLCALLISGTSYPTPAASASVVAGYFAGHSFAATLNGFLVFGASVPLGIYAATVYARLQRLGIRVPGPNIAFYGGIAASVLLSIAGLLTWALGQAAGDVPASVVRLLADLVFALGGIGFVGGLGLLIAGIAVPALILRLVPRWLAWAGLVLAALCELSFFGLLWPALQPLLPIGRFLGLPWLAVIGFLLPINRHEVPRRAGRP